MTYHPTGKWSPCLGWLNWSSLIKEAKGREATAVAKGLMPRELSWWPVAWGIQNNSQYLGSKSSLVPTLQTESPWEEGSSWWLTPPPGFVEIPWENNPPCEVVGIPQGLAEEQDPIQVVGSAMFFARPVQDMISSSTYINVMTCSMSLVGLGVTPSAGDCSMPTLLGEEDTDLTKSPLPVAVACPGWWLFAFD